MKYIKKFDNINSYSDEPIDRAIKEVSLDIPAHIYSAIKDLSLDIPAHILQNKFEFVKPSSISLKSGKRYITEKGLIELFKNLKNCDYNNVETKEDVINIIIKNGGDEKDWDIFISDITNKKTNIPLILRLYDVDYLVDGNITLLIYKVLGKVLVGLPDVKIVDIDNRKFKNGDFVYLNSKSIFSSLKNGKKYKIKSVGNIGNDYIDIIDETGVSSYHKSYFISEFEYELKKYNL